MSRRSVTHQGAWRAGALAVIGIAIAPSAPVRADALAYQRPPEVVEAIVDAPPTPVVLLSPDERSVAILEQPSLPPIAELAEPELRLAGLRLRQRTNGPSRDLHFRTITIADLDGKGTEVAGLPTEARIGDVAWSPDSAHVAFTNTEAEGISLWVVERRSGKARRLTAARVNAAVRDPFQWVPPGTALVARLVPGGRGAAPEAPRVPAGPVVQESSGRKAPARTYQDLLKSPFDESLLDHYLGCQVVRVALDGATPEDAIVPLGTPGTILDVLPSPDGAHLLVETLHRPYSYKVPLERFPRRIEVWDAAGRVEKLLVDQPLAEEIPLAFGSVRTGPREHAWRADAPATVVWAEARDGGDAKREAEIRDELYLLDAPFAAEPRSLCKLALRFGDVQWSDGKLALVTDWWWPDRRRRTQVVAPDDLAAAPRTLWDRSWEDRYGDPGDPDVRSTPQGTKVLRRDGGGGHLFLLGDGASPEGDRPFLDRLDLATGKSERLWRSEAPYFERAITVLDLEGRRFLTRRETSDTPPNFFVHEPGAREPRPVTRFPHPTPALAGIDKQLLRYERADGVKLTAALYLPKGHDPKRQGPLPVVFWAYPQEYKSADAAGQMMDSPHRFVRVAWWSPLPLLTQGYAVLDNPSLPIVGEGKTEPNDTYVPQLVAGAKAAIDELVRLGVADRDRVAIGGHSYGAFTTANLLAHSDLFRTGIARSGAYNRTLTPFSFQEEERTLWEAERVYLEMSPLMHADRIDEPILLVHGEADNNAGTHTMQSERLFEALKGLGGTVRLVLLPHESHSYRARESVLHMWQEQIAWLDKHVKQASPRAPEEPSAPPPPEVAPGSPSR